MINAPVFATAQPLAIEGASRHPTVFITPEQIDHARLNTKRYAWAREIADAVVQEADSWVARDDAWFHQIIPRPGAAFAYGITGCPVCGAFWGAWGQGAADFDHSRTLLCKNGHRTPDAAHPDTGAGYLAPDGRIHYIIGTYNAWVVETLSFHALDSLAYAFTLTGDDRYAAKAAVILDEIAALYPSSQKGCWDYPEENLSGRLARPWYQASRVLIHYVNQYDQIFHSEALSQPSVAPGLTRRQNIEKNLLMNGGAYCHDLTRLGRLHNGTADYARGALAVGVCLGIPEYVRHAVESPYGIEALLTNSIGRDGDYAEITSLYADHTRELYFTFAEPLLHYRGSAYPGGLNLYQHPKFRRFLEPHNLPLTIAGHMPRYGDSQPDLKQRPPSARPFDRSDYDFLEKLYVRSDHDEAIGNLLAWIANGIFAWLRSLASDTADTNRPFVDRRIPAGISLYREPGDQLGASLFDRMWMLFNADEPPQETQPLSSLWQRRLLKSDFQGQKGMAVLRVRAEDSPATVTHNAPVKSDRPSWHQQGLMLRYGPALNHAHLDDLNVNYAALGNELTYDLGYSRTAATMTQMSWAKQTASHNVVVVNEKSQREGGSSGGSLWLFADTENAKVVEASSELCYSQEGVSVYRRLAALIGDGPEAYWVDIFRVKGGHQHDWMFHSLGDTLTIHGVNMGPKEKGSLAGPDISWSDQLMPDGDLRDLAPTAAVAMGQVAPPGNGYGFLINPAHGHLPHAWSADWQIDEHTHLRLHAPGDPTSELISARACGLYPEYPAVEQVIIRRRGTNLDSQFVAAIEPYTDTPRIKQVERLPIPKDPAPASIVPVAMKITAVDGRIDYVYSARDTEKRRVADFTFAAHFAHLRLQNGELKSLTLVGGRSFSGAGWTLTPAQDGWRGTLGSIDFVANSFVTNSPLPADGSLDAAAITFNNPRYSRNTAYRILRVESANGGSRVFVDGSFILGKGRVTTITGLNNLTSDLSHEYALSAAPDGTHSFFSGKRIFTAGGAETQIRRIQLRQASEPLYLNVDSTAGLHSDEMFSYADVQSGDTFEILSVSTIQRRPDGKYRLSGSGSAQFIAPSNCAVDR